MTAEGQRPDPADAELLRQWEVKIAAAGDPLGALADLLSQGTARRSTLFQRVGERVLGCELRSILGAGGMGVTYGGVAADGAPVAVKMVLGVGGSAAARFEQECRLLQSFDHPAIVRYRDHAVLDEGTGVLVMDRVEGVDLEQLLQDVLRDAPPATEPGRALMHDVEGSLAARLLSPRYRRRVLRLLATVADGLEAAHRRGIVHRDVKPANVLVRDDLSPVLIDFGLARDQQIKVSFTASGAAMGTLAYMAPEQLGRDPGAVDARTDVYALGLVLFRALLGREARDDVKDVVRAASQPFLLDARQSRTLPIDLQAILYQCLDPRPARRYPTMQAFADDLRAAAGAGAVAARRPGLLRRMVRDRGLRRSAAFAVGVIGLLAAVSAWPRGREVVFATNVEAADATLALADGRTIAPGDPVWLPYGPVEVTLQGAAIQTVRRVVDVESGLGRQWELMRSRYEQIVSGEFRLPGRTIVQFTSGHSFLQMAPDVATDQRWVDGVAVKNWAPLDKAAVVVPGIHDFRARDGKGREETQRLAVGAEPEDVQLLPAILSHVDGRYRRTWSTVWSPLPDDLAWSGTAVRWLGTPRSPEIAGGGTMTNDCAFAPGVAKTPASIELRCRFPERMRSAVCYLRGSIQAGGTLAVSAGFAGEALRPWPLLPDGHLAPLQEFASADGADAFVVRATLSATTTSTPVVALARLCEGALFGGHWRTDPPCFALVADPQPGVAVLQSQVGVDLARVAVWPARPVMPLPAGDNNGRILVLMGPAGERRYVLSHRVADEGHAAVLWLDPATGAETSRLGAEWLHPRQSWYDGRPFGEYLAAVPDLDGDGWQELALGDNSSSLRGTVSGGAVALRRSRDGARAWVWPIEPSYATFADDGACQVFVAGDWNGDGRSDVALGAPNAGLPQGGEKVGYFAVVDAQTGATLWAEYGTTARQAPWIFDVLPPPGGGPAALLLVSHIRQPASDRDRARQAGLRFDGVAGRVEWLPEVQPDSNFGIVGRIGGDARPSVVSLRRGPWHDGFEGLERFEPHAGGMRLAARCAIVGMGQDVGPSLPHNGTLQLPDIDGDDVSDLAFPVTGELQSIVFVSGRTAQPLARTPLPGRVGAPARFELIWPSLEPAHDGRPARLLMPLRTLGSNEWTLFAIELPQPR